MAANSAAATLAPSSATQARTDFVLIGAILVMALFATTELSRILPELRNVVMAASIGLACIFVGIVAVNDSATALIDFLRAPFLLYAYLLLSLICNILSGGAMLHIVPFVAYLISTYVFFYLIPVALLRDPARLDFLFRAFLALSAFTAFTAFLPYLGLKSFFFFPFYVKNAYAATAGFAASGGITEYPLTLGTFMMMAATLSAYRYLQAPSRGRAALVVLFVLTLIASQARGGFFALGVAGVIFFCPRYFLEKGWRLLTLLPVLVILAAVAYIVLSALPGLSGYFRTDKGTSDRTMIWAAVLLMVAKQPWTGYGFGSSSDFVASLGPAMATLGAAAVADVHNTFLTSAFEGGVLTSVTYAALFLFPIFRVAQSRLPILHKRFYIGMGLGIFVANVWIDNNFGGMRITSVMVTLFIGLAYQLSRMPIEEAARALAYSGGVQPSSGAAVQT